MGKLRNDFDAFKAQQTELSQSLTQRLHSLEVLYQNSVREFNENTGTFATVAQVMNILEKLISFDSRIKRLEDRNPANNQVKFVREC
jgi:hypothetical protein